MAQSLLQPVRCRRARSSPGRGDRLAPNWKGQSRRRANFERSGSDRSGAWLTGRLDGRKWDVVKWWPSKSVDGDLVTYGGLVKTDRVARLKYRVADEQGGPALRDDIFVFRESKVRAVPRGDNWWWHEWGGWTGLIIQGAPEATAGSRRADSQSCQHGEVAAADFRGLGRRSAGATAPKGVGKPRERAGTEGSVARPCLVKAAERQAAARSVVGEIRGCSRSGPCANVAQRQSARLGRDPLLEAAQFYRVSLVDKSATVGSGARRRRRQTLAARRRHTAGPCPTRACLPHPHSPHAAGEGPEGRRPPVSNRAGNGRADCRSRPQAA